MKIWNKAKENLRNIVKDMDDMLIIIFYFFINIYSNLNKI